MKKLYCSRDSVSGVWMDPVALNNDSEAIRSFNYALTSSTMHDCYLKDIDLYCVGSFDENTGLVSSCNPRHIINGHNDEVIQYRRFYDKEDSDYEISEEEA